jgi:hypothetical protein
VSATSRASPPGQEIIDTRHSAGRVSLTDAADMRAVSTKAVRRYLVDGHLDALRLRRLTLWIKLESIGQAWAG